MLNAVNNGDTSTRMQRSLDVGQFQLLACVYHVFPGDQTCIPEIIIIDFPWYFPTAHATPSTWMQWTTTVCEAILCRRARHRHRTANVRMGTRACTHTAESHAYEHARLQVHVSTSMHTCTSTHMHSCMRAQMDIIRMNTPSRVSTRTQSLRMHLAPFPCIYNLARQSPAHTQLLDIPASSSPSLRTFPTISRHPRSLPTPRLQP